MAILNPVSPYPLNLGGAISHAKFGGWSVPSKREEKRIKKQGKSENENSKGIEKARDSKKARIGGSGLRFGSFFLLAPEFLAIPGPSFWESCDLRFCAAKVFPVVSKLITDRHFSGGN